MGGGPPIQIQAPGYLSSGGFRLFLFGREPQRVVDSLVRLSKNRVGGALSAG